MQQEDFDGPGGTRWPPPDLERAFGQARDFVRGPGRWQIGAAALGMLVVVLLWSSWFTVQPEETGIVQRFGAVVRTVGPGLHFKLPVRDRDGPDGSHGPSPQGGIRLPDGCHGCRPANAIRADKSLQGRVPHADGGPQRDRRPVDRPVPDRGPDPLPLQGPGDAADDPGHRRGGHAPGGRQPPRERRPDRRPCGRVHRGEGGDAEDPDRRTRPVSAWSRWNSRT